MAILGDKLVAENRRADPLTKVMSVTLITKCGLKIRTKNGHLQFWVLGNV